MFLDSRTLFCMSAHVCLPALLFLQRSYLSQCGGGELFSFENLQDVCWRTLLMSLPAITRSLLDSVFCNAKTPKGGCGQKVGHLQGVTSVFKGRKDQGGSVIYPL